MKRQSVSRRGIALGLALGIALLVSHLAAQVAPAQPAAQKSGRHWALLVGVERYHRANPLRYTINDVKQLSQVLRDRAYVAADHVLEMTDEQTNPRFQPLKTSLMSELPTWLSRSGPDDSVLIYFSGHGFRDPQGHLYLAPIDCDPAQPAATGVPVSWIRDQIAACPAKFKLLILDACHAGSEKGDDDEKGVVGKDLAEPFRDLEGVVTLASSTGDEKSQIWEEKQRSLFSYWLTEGLKGHADDDGDGVIDIDELNKFVHRSVTTTAKARFPRAQTPVRIVRSGAPGVPIVVRLKPLTLKQLLSDTAEQLSQAADDNRIARLGVLEFTNDTRLGELLGADFGLLGRYCAEELERRLLQFGEGKFKVVDRRRLLSVLQQQNFQLSDLGSPDALKRLSDRADGIQVIALGTLRNRAGRVVTIQTRLMKTESDDLAGSAGGNASLSESEWAMLGRSAALSPDDRRPQFPTDDQPMQPVEDQVVVRLDTLSTKAHPLADPKFPFRVRIQVDGKERPGKLQGNDWIVPLKQGEKYEIIVENRTGRMAMMRLLVDGLNTLPEKEKTKGVVTYLVGQRVNLEEARPWVLDPARGTVNAIRGFVTETGVQGKLRDFVVVDATESLAARQKFTDQIGLITAAFYMPVSGSRGGVGTGLGEERTEDLTERTGFKPGSLLGVLHIKYVDAAKP